MNWKVYEVNLKKAAAWYCLVLSLGNRSMKSKVSVWNSALGENREVCDSYESTVLEVQSAKTALSVEHMYSSLHFDSTFHCSSILSE